MEASPFGIEVRAETGHTVVVLCGELDLASQPRCQAVFTEALSGRAPVVVDVAGLRFVDARGLSTLLELRHAQARRGDPTVLRGAGPWLRRLLEIAELDESFDYSD